ncbi:hypothetical protein [Pseudomonas sp. Irchel 3E20]|uniref:hypothetical protein n=1 Tax=Pseudomonas sp. Irchel 3E20 TaxID=2008983 RepID=UPI001595E79F|nr:hypothetical protein [Pseudomonas sp. Irchel 3E20]
MRIFTDEVAYWDEITARFIQANATAGGRADYIVEAAVLYAELMIKARRELKIEKVPE